MPRASQTRPALIAIEAATAQSRALQLRWIVRAPPAPGSPICAHRQSRRASTARSASLECGRGLRAARHVWLATPARMRTLLASPSASCAPPARSRRWPGSGIARSAPPATTARLAHQQSCRAPPEATRACLASPASWSARLALPAPHAPPALPRPPTAQAAQSRQAVSSQRARGASRARISPPRAGRHASTVQPARIAPRARAPTCFATRAATRM